MIILGIETSCDETALALIETSGHDQSLEVRVINSLVHSQAELHSAYGGVYPNLAKREHGKNLVPLLHKLLTDSGFVGGSRGTVSAPEEIIESFRKEYAGRNPELFESFLHANFLNNNPNIDRIAVTEGPGLEPALWVGITFATMLGRLWDIPIVPVNHMEGHVIGSLLPSDASNGAWQKLYTLPLPSVALLISGGHTELVKIEEGERKSGYASYSYSIIGQTKDDAVGEAFDKAARLLGLPYPGGPHISKLSHEAWERKIQAPIINGKLLSLPRPMMHSNDLDFSFSGLKTAVLYAIRDANKSSTLPLLNNISLDSKETIPLTEEFKMGLAHEFEQAVSDVLGAKLHAAIEKTDAKSIIIGGGVSANHALRKRFELTAREYGIPLFLPSRHISGDNALMIALAGAMNEKLPALGRELRAHGTKRLD